MDLPRITKPVWDKCIYCGNAPNSGSVLGKEHIIPLSFGGRWELLAASCRSCERITSEFEKRAADNIVTPIREHLGLLGRQQKRPRPRMPVNLVKLQQQESHMVPASDHPAVMLMWRFDLPTALTGDSLLEDVVARIVIRPLTNDFHARAERLAERGGQINLIGRMPAEPHSFARMLAKIAHSYAMAKLGPKAFRPLLREIILGEKPNYPPHFIGGTSPPDYGNALSRQKRSSARYCVSHEWRPRLDQGSFLIVTIRLFGDYGMPIFQVVTGERIDTAKPYRATDVHPITRLRLSGIYLFDDPSGRAMRERLLSQRVPTSSEAAPPVFQ
jgi:hypothetical protein